VTRRLALLVLLLLSASLSAQDLPEAGGLERLNALIVKLRLQNKQRIEQYQILLELSNSSTEQLTALSQALDLRESELRLLRSIRDSQGSYINSLLIRTEELTKITERQSQLLKSSSLKNKALVVGICVGIPVAFIAGLLVGR
jgi:hypothetical protein